MLAVKGARALGNACMGHAANQAAALQVGWGGLGVGGWVGGIGGDVGVWVGVWEGGGVMLWAGCCAGSGRRVLVRVVFQHHLALSPPHSPRASPKTQN